MDVGMAEAGQGCDEPLHREEEGRPHLDVLAETYGLWGSAPCRWDVDLVDQDATRARWTTSGARGSMLGSSGTCDRLLEPQEGQRFAHWMVIVP
jgi:hypothetical protein